MESSEEDELGQSEIVESESKSECEESEEDDLSASSIAHIIR